MAYEGSRFESIELVGDVDSVARRVEILLNFDHEGQMGYTIPFVDKEGNSLSEEDVARIRDKVNVFIARVKDIAAGSN